MAVKRVNEFDFYSLGAKQLAEKTGISMPKAVAVVDHLGLRNQPDCYKEIKIGKAVFKRYSPKALEVMQMGLRSTSAEEIWRLRRGARRQT